jgi:hypothetical protein
LDYDTTHSSTRRPEFANNIANAYRQLGDTKRANEWREKSVEWAREKRAADEPGK